MRADPWWIADCAHPWVQLYDHLTTIRCFDGEFIRFELLERASPKYKTQKCSQRRVQMEANEAAGGPNVSQSSELGQITGRAKGCSLRATRLYHATVDPDCFTNETWQERAVDARSNFLHGRVEVTCLRV